MAKKAYRIKQDVAFPKVISKVKGEGDSAEYEVEGTNYSAGSYITDAEMTPRDKKRAEDGELEHLLEPVDLEEAESYAGNEPQFGIFFPEHEAEAHALKQYGHRIIPKDQQLEIMASDAKFSAEYQAHVKEQGLDRRPVQEFLAQPEERVPSVVLHGSETPAGVPHNRGPEHEYNEDGEVDTGEDAPRQAPGQPSSESSSTESLAYDPTTSSE